MYVSYNLKYCYIQRRGAERRRTLLILLRDQRQETNAEDFQHGNDFVMAFSTTLPVVFLYFEHVETYTHMLC